MGTRCGSIDPAIVTTVMAARNLSPAEMDTLMNKKSGMLGIAGTSDNRTIEGLARTATRRLSSLRICSATSSSNT